MATVVLNLNTIPATPPNQITFLRHQPSRRRNSSNFSTCLKFNTPSKSSFIRASDQEDSNNSETTLQKYGEVEHDIGVKAALSILRFYKTQISPILPRSCRYVPTCSEYSMEAYKRYGFFKGTTLTVYRLCRCNPLGGSGYDPPRWFGEIRPSPDQEQEQLDDNS